MRRAAVLAAALLVAASVPALAGHGGSTVELDRDGLAGDTFAFEVTPVSGDDLTILAGSSFTITAHYPAFREDSAVAWAATDLTTVAFESVFYFTDQGTGEAHVEVLTDRTDVEVSVDEAEPWFDEITWDATIVGDLHLSGDAPWTLAVTTPEAASVDVDATFHLAESAGVTGEGVAGAGVVAATEDFDGTAQVSSRQTAAVGMEATAEAPDGTRGFAVMYPFRSTGAGWYGVEAPGPRDDQHLVVADDEEPPAAHVLAGPSGLYRHWVRSAAWSHTGGLDGRVAVFFAVPVL